MALPVTITGLDAGAQYNSQPFISSGGNVYVFGRDSTDESKMRAFKATDPTSSFSNVGTDFDVDATAGVVVRNLVAYQVSDVIHIVTSTAALTDSAYAIKYHTFNMATDAWVITNEAVVSPSTPLSTSACNHVGMAIRSDGDVIVLYNGNSAASMGSDYRRVYYARREGGTWTVDVGVDNGGADHWDASGVVLGSSDRMHLFFLNDDLSDAYQRTLTSANSLEAFPSAYDTDISTVESTSIFSGVSYVSGANTKVRFPSTDATANTLNSVKLDSADAPTVSIDSDITGATGQSAGFLDASFSVNGTTLWNTFVNSTDDIYTQSNADDGGWTTPESFLVGSILNLRTNIYTRGSDVVLAIVYSISGAVNYHEKVIVAGGSTLTATATATATWTGALIAGSNLSSSALASVTWGGTGLHNAAFNQAATASVTWTGAEILAAVEADWSSTAAATVTWGGTGLYPAAFTSAAAATVTFNGIATAASNLDSNAIAVLTWNGISTAASSLSASAAAALTWNGAALAYADWTSTAIADLQWVGEELVIAASDWSSTATASVTWNGTATASASLDSAAVATVTWNGVSTASSNLSSNAAAVLTWNGIATAASSCSAAAVSSVTFNGTGLYPAALDAAAAASLTWNGAELALESAAWSSAAAAALTWNGVSTASGYIDTDIDAFATLRMAGATVGSADWSSDAAASVTWEGVAQAPNVEAGAFSSTAAATLTMTGESSVTATWNAVATAALTMAGVEVTAAAWSAAAVTTITFTGVEVGETGQLDVNAAASVTWGGADATPATGLSAIVRDGWRVKADMARELEELDEEDILAMLAAAVAYMEVA